MLGEDGKKIKAISCELSAASCKLTILLRFKSLRQASILNRTTCAGSRQYSISGTCVFISLKISAF